MVSSVPLPHACPYFHHRHPSQLLFYASLSYHALPVYFSSRCTHTPLDPPQFAYPLSFFDLFPLCVQPGTSAIAQLLYHFWGSPVFPMSKAFIASSILSPKHFQSLLSSAFPTLFFLTFLYCNITTRNEWLFSFPTLN